MEKVKDYRVEQKLERDFIQKIEDLENFLQRRGGAQDDSVDFVVTGVERDEIKKNYELMLEAVKNVDVVFERENSLLTQKYRAVLEELKKQGGSGVDQNFLAFNRVEDPENIPGAQMFETDLSGFGDDNGVMIEELRGNAGQNLMRMDPAWKESMETTLEGLRQDRQQAQLQESYEFVKKRHEMVTNVRDLELEVDSRLGELFADFYLVSPKQKCMPDTLLAFKIFMLSKTNTVIEMGAFLKAFFKRLAVKHEPEAKRLLLLMYSLFGNVEIMGKMAVRLAGLSYQDDRPEFDNVIESFSHDYVVTVEAYKDLTDFSKKLEQMESRRFLKVTARVGAFIRAIFLKYLRLARKVRTRMWINEALDLLLDILVTTVSTLFGVPFLRRFIKRLISDLLLRLIEFLLDTAGLNVEKIPGLLKAFGRKLSSFFSKQMVESLDWPELLHRKLEPAQVSPELQFESDIATIDLETHIYEVATDPNNLYNKTERLEIFLLSDEHRKQMLPPLIQRDDFDTSLHDFGIQDRMLGDFEGRWKRHIAEQRSQPSPEQEKAMSAFRDVLKLI